MWLISVTGRNYSSFNRPRQFSFIGSKIIGYQFCFGSQVVFSRRNRFFINLFSCSFGFRLCFFAVSLCNILTFELLNLLVNIRNLLLPFLDIISIFPLVFVDSDHYDIKRFSLFFKICQFFLGFLQQFLLFGFLLLQSLIFYCQNLRFLLYFFSLFLTKISILLHILNAFVSL